MFNIVLVLVLAVVGANYVREDGVMYSVKWPGPAFDVSSESAGLKPELLQMTTSSSESYTCRIPNRPSISESEPMVRSAETLLQNFTDHFTKFVKSKPRCIQKPENFWIFELCHGSQIRQFHTGGPEFEMGYFDNLTEFWLDQRILDRKRAHGFFVRHDQGSACPLLGKEAERSTNVFYTCGHERKIVRITEVATCVYEIIYTDPWVCEVHNSGIEDLTEEINCVPHEKVAHIPAAQAELNAKVEKAIKAEGESSMMVKTMDGKRFFVHILFEGDEKQQVLVENRASDSIRTAPLSPNPLNPMLSSSSENDTTYILRYVFNGNCVQGDFGYWQYEFCYGYWVRQLHHFGPGSTHSIVLGRWNQEKHVEWYKNLPSQPDNNSIPLFYSDGDSCAAIAGQNRNVRVVLKCVEENKPIATGKFVKSSDERVARGLKIRLHEPTSCNYVLIVESPAFCRLHEFVDKETGLINTGAMFLDEMSTVDSEENEKIDETVERI